MKFVGILIFSIGIALLIFILIKYYQDSQTIKSPVPKDRGIKVIFLTPKPTK